MILVKNEVTKITKAATGVSQRKGTSFLEQSWLFLAASPSGAVFTQCLCVCSAQVAAGAFWQSEVQEVNFRLILQCPVSLKGSEGALSHLLFCGMHRQVLFVMQLVIQPTTKGMYFFEVFSKNSSKFFFNNAAF